MMFNSAKPRQNSDSGLTPGAYFLKQVFVPPRRGAPATSQAKSGPSMSVVPSRSSVHREIVTGASGVPNLEALLVEVSSARRSTQLGEIAPAIMSSSLCFSFSQP